MATINYAVQYSRELANAYPYLSHFSDLYNSENSNRYKPIGGKGVYIPTVTVSGATAVNRDRISGHFSRNADVSWELKTMSMERKWDTIIDPMDIDETNEALTIGNITRNFNSFQKVPEMDAYAASKIASYAAAFGGITSTSLTTDNILGYWDNAISYMVNQRVPRDRIMCKVTPETYAKLKGAAGITRFVDVGGVELNVNRNIARLDGVRIEEVPADLMKTAYNFDEGWVAADGAAQINMILYDPSALVAPIKYEVSMVSAPSAATRGKYVYYEEYYYDVFKLDNRQGGLYVFTTAPSLPSITVTSVAGTVDDGDTVITVSGDNVGAYGVDLYYYAGTDTATSLTFGADIPDTFTKTANNPFTLSSQTAGKYVTCAIVNAQTGKVIGGGNAVEVVKA